MMQKITGYIATFLAGVAAAFFLILKTTKATIENNYDIGKIKTKGEGNLVDINVSSLNNDEINKLKSHKLLTKWRQRRQFKKAKK